MLSQIEMLAPRPRITTRTAEAVHVAIDVFPDSSKVIFIITTPVHGVEVDPKDPSILIVHPGSYFLDFNIQKDALNNPAILVPTTFGTAGVARSSASTVTLFNDNALTSGEELQILEFTFNFASGPHDPTIVNTPDPA